MILQPENMPTAPNLQAIVDAVGMGVWDMNLEAGSLYMDERCRAYFGLLSIHRVEYAMVIAAIHPDDRLAVDLAVNNALDPHTGGGYTIRYRVQGPADSDIPERWIYARGQAHFDATGKATRLMGTVTDITHEITDHERQDISTRVQASKAIAASERRFRSLVEEAPVPTALFVGRNLVIEVANKPMLDVWGKGASALDKPLAVAVPELQEQRFIRILEEIFDTGMPYHEKQGMVMLEVDGRLSPYHFNYTYQPMFDDNGKVYAVLNMAIDVTEQVLARQKEQATQKMLQSAVEIASLGTWQYYPDTDKLHCSPRMCDWLGTPHYRSTSLVALLRATNRKESLQNAFHEAIAPGSQGKIDIEFPLERAGAAHKLLLHIQGAVFRDADDKPVVIGTSEDITNRREWEYQLEQLVTERTEELAAANEELASTNEELLEANENLYRSNTELEQYAYVASHDLQEPLRKIQVFSTMLQSQAALNDPGLTLVEKILSSSRRLTCLIQDLLQYSRLLRADGGAIPVDLNKVVKAVTDDFELVLTEKQGTILRDTLPTVTASVMQMNQLFYNLISNGLKFISAGTQPLIQISSEAMSLAAVQPFINRPMQGVQYHRIKVQDNGIGIEQKFEEQIFEVFKRLHNQSAFPGSGIGLALCRKIVANYGGHIYVESAPGEGAAFCVILPGPLVAV